MDQPYCSTWTPISSSSSPCDVDVDDDHEYDILPKLPLSILKCRTLVSLDLAQFRVKGFPFSSVGFGFPSLNELHLKKIVFHDVQDFMLLLAGCPNLEYLRAEHIFVHYDQDSLTIQEFKSVSLPKLISADITRCWFPCFPVKALSSSEHLCVETSMLCKQDHKVYEIDPRQCPCYDIPIFHNLTHLELHDTLELVPQVLKYCPKLQNLELYEEEHEEVGLEENWVEPEVVPQCLSSCLRNCTIHNLSGELIIAKYILKNARNLQMMEIWSIMDDQSEIERKLSACPKASATCQLFIY